MSASMNIGCPNSNNMLHDYRTMVMLTSIVRSGRASHPYAWLARRRAARARGSHTKTIKLPPITVATSF